MFLNFRNTQNGSKRPPILKCYLSSYQALKILKNHILCAVCSFRVKVSQSEILVERFFRSLANIFIIHYKKKLEPTKSNFQKIGYANQKLTFWLQIILSICLVCIAICRRLLFVALITTSLIVTLNKNNNIELFSL